MKIDNKQPDLLYLDCILVTTGPNSNTDFFLSEDVYNAINSVQYKVVDLEHHAGEDDPESQIIGTMGEAWFEDLSGQKIVTAKFEDMPNEFNIVTRAVIWKYLFESVANDLEQRFIDKKLYCSLECWFWKYDYALKQTDGSYTIIKRNKQTAALSKYLRFYGGEGIFKGKSIYRVPRGFVFGGMGIVENPANKRSKIKDVASKIVEPQSVDVTNLVKKILIS